MPLSDSSQAHNLGLNGLKICICTPDYMHLIRNGGIGTSFQHTISVLAPMGAAITVLYANLTPGMSEEDREHAAKLVERDGAKLEYLFPEPLGDAISSIYPNDIFTASSYFAYQWLKTRDFDLVIFADWRGIAFHSVHAKRQNLAFQRTQLWIQAHSTALWHELNNQQANYDETNIRVYHYERKSIELCDRVLGATQYLLDWMTEHGFKLPEQTSVFPLIINGNLLAGAGLASSSAAAAAPNTRIREIAFFGRLEKRKGLHVFLQALQRLAKYNRDLLDRNEIRISFLGKITSVDGSNSLTFIERELHGLDLKVSLNPALSSSEAISYLKKNDALAIMPSLTDNSPLTVHECINAGIPFIAARSGGIPELIHPEDHDTTLVDPSPVQLATRIVEIVGNGQRRVRPAVNQAADNIPRWVNLLKDVPNANQTAAPAQASSPLVSVCLVHFERPALLKKTLDGLAAQTYKNFEIILVDNDSRTPEAVEFLSKVKDRYSDLQIRVERLPDLYAGAARNKALSLARGDYIVFMDDDNYAHPSQIELFVRAIVSSGFDALSCALIVFDGEDDPQDLQRFIHLFLPAGSGIALNLFSNSYGDANGIYRKSAIEAVGGLTEERLSWEDYELFSKLEQHGFKVGTIPEPLVYLRAVVGSVSRRGSMLSNYYRALRPALKNFPWSTFGDALLIAISPRLQSAVAQRFDAEDQVEDKRILYHSEIPLVVSRLLIERAYRREGYPAALRHLERLISAGGSQDRYKSDHFFLQVAALLSSIPVQDDDEEKFALATECAQIIKRRDFSAVVEFLHEHEVPASAIDLSYRIGLGKILTGEVEAGLTIWASMIDGIEIEYLKDSPDIRTGVEKKHLRSGIQHYLQYGYAECRRCRYTPPLRSPLAADSILVPENYFATIQSILNASAATAVPRIEGLLTEIISGGSVIAAGDFAKLLLNEAEPMYLRDHADVERSINAGETLDVSSHWTMFGHAEDDRYHAIHSVNSETVEQAVYDRLLGRRVAHEMAAFRYENSRIKDWVSGIERGL
ncbi:glycosyltransferase [Methylobacterium sp. J-076]|uniref:glycosyltransferase n=1 Tax=Methylobacterium sp. J-076 TaxID=2836655 RepID=UPI001FB99B27|nr:glycosyltransferase [Methylobacterium sp. J-076]MCJ2011958.1 glycosyltransferase [Methylobacterium sp. J-076]